MIIKFKTKCHFLTLQWTRITVTLITRVMFIFPCSTITLYSSVFTSQIPFILIPVIKASSGSTRLTRHAAERQRRLDEPSDLLVCVCVCVCVCGGGHHSPSAELGVEWSSRPCLCAPPPLGPPARLLSGRSHVKEFEFGNRIAFPRGVSPPPRQGALGAPLV